MRKRIIASLMALAALVAPVAVLGDVDGTITRAIPVEGIMFEPISANVISFTHEEIAGAVASVSQFIEFEGGRPYLPLRRVAEAHGANVSWNNATRTVTISMSGAEAASLFGGQVPALAAVLPGTFTLELQEVAGRLQVANGPAAGTRLVAYMVNDRFVIPVTPIPQGASPASVAGMLNPANNLIGMALSVLTGGSGQFNYEITQNGVNITLN